MPTDPERPPSAPTEERYQALRKQFQDARDDFAQREQIAYEIACDLLPAIVRYASTKLRSVASLRSNEPSAKEEIVKRVYLKFFRYCSQNAKI